MSKKYCSLLYDFKIYLVVFLLLTSCGTEPQRVNSNDGARLSQSSSSYASSNKASSLASSSQPSSSNSPNNKVVTQLSSLAPLKITALASSSSSVKVSNRPALANSTSSAAVATSSLAASTVPKIALAGISGVVKVTGKNGETISPEGVIINLEPTSISNDLVTDQRKRQHEVNMLDKTYNPKLMTLKQNDQVTFKNADKIKHNVFSTSGGNRFDLGTYGEGEKNSVSLKSSGVVKVYCNIHPEMALFISVSQHNYSHITDKSGAFEINNLPAGEYRLTAWHIRGETQQVVNLQGSRTKKDILINTESYVPTPHKNKYDEAYKVKPVLFGDEFY